MKFMKKTRFVLTVFGVIVGLAVATGWVASANKVSAGAKAYNLPRVYSYSFGANQTGTWFATMHKTGEVTTDPITLNVDAKAVPVNLGPGRGVWKYNATKNKVIITTYHTDLDNTSKYWTVVQTTTPDGAQTLTGSVKLSRFASIGDTNPEASYNALCTNEALKE